MGKIICGGKWKQYQNEYLVKNKGDYLIDYEKFVEYLLKNV